MGPYETECLLPSDTSAFIYPPSPVAILSKPFLTLRNGFTLTLGLTSAKVDVYADKSFGQVHRHEEISSGKGPRKCSKLDFGQNLVLKMCIRDEGEKDAGRR